MLRAKSYERRKRRLVMITADFSFRVKSKNFTPLRTLRALRFFRVKSEEQNLLNADDADWL
jgi:hypothetical protein